MKQAWASAVVALTVLGGCDRPAAAEAPVEKAAQADTGGPSCPEKMAAACARWREMYRRQQAQLAWIKTDNAEADADRAIADGDFRLYGVYGYSTDTPGVESGDFIPNGCGLKMIDGTSDYVADHDFFERPRAYALRYNRWVLAKTACWSKPLARRGMAWSGHAYGARSFLDFTVPDTSYDYLLFYCDGASGPVTVHQVRPGASAGGTRATLASGSLRLGFAAKLEAPDADLPRRDFAYLRAEVPADAPVLTEFARTGRIALDGDAFDASTDAERKAITEFVRACRTPASRDGASH